MPKKIGRGIHNDGLSSLAFDPEMGEVDPRTYPLICYIRLKCLDIGSTERILQINRMTRALDLICTESGDAQTRVHYTNKPGMESAECVEVRIQPLLTSAEDEPALVEKVRAQIDVLREKGKTMGWEILDLD